MTGYIKKTNLISGLIVAFFTFFIALLVSLGSGALVRAVNNVIVAIILLLIVIFLGIVFDIIGTAAAAAEISHFNARAAKKVFGAKQAVKITGNAHLVANFCNDVVGDIAGTLSGALGAGIIASLASRVALIDIILASALMTSLIASLTVGGKAIGKRMALNYANGIIFKVAIIIAWAEKISGMELFKGRR